MSARTPVLAVADAPAPVWSPVPSWPLPAEPVASISLSPPAESAPVDHVDLDGGAARTVGLAILLGALFQAVSYVLGRQGTLQPDTAIRIGLYGTLAFYAVVLWLVLGRVRHAQLVLTWSRGDPVSGAAIGFIVGCAGALVMLGIQQAAVEHPTSDTYIQLVVSEGSPARILLAVVIFAVAAPVVEELLFRGVVAEALRYRGVGKAMSVSAFFFALWHLRPPFLYFWLAGVLLCWVYWHRGLLGSMVAHATFNGALVIAAVVWTIGPAHTITANGVMADVPAAWHRVTAGVPAELDLVVEGPSGSALVVNHIDLPVSLDPAALAMALQAGRIPLPDDSAVVPGSVRVDDLPIGPAVRARVTIDGATREEVIVIRGGRMWEIRLQDGGSARARRDFEGILDSLRLPSAP